MTVTLLRVLVCFERKKYTFIIPHGYMASKLRKNVEKKRYVLTSCFQLTGVDILGPDMDPCTYPCTMRFIFEMLVSKFRNFEFRLFFSSPQMPNFTCEIVLEVMVDLEIWYWAHPFRFRPQPLCNRMLHQELHHRSNHHRILHLERNSFRCPNYEIFVCCLNEAMKSKTIT